MIGIFSLLLVLIGIVFLGVLVGIWRYKSKWSTTKRLVITLICAVSLLAVLYAAFGLLLIVSDRAVYSASGKNLGDIDYETVISNAHEAGYTVDGPYYVNVEPEEAGGLHPPGIKELDELLGEEYRIRLVTFYYAEDTFFETTLPGVYEGKTSIAFFNRSRPDPYFAPFELQHLPSDEWVIETFALLFDLTESKAQNYLAQLKDSVAEQETTSPTIMIEEHPNLTAVYEHFKETSSNATLSLPVGEGWTRQTFYRQGNQIGALVYIVPNMRIMHQDSGHTYTITIDQLGGVKLEIELDAGEQIPEEEYRIGICLAL
ncbi:MAG TPA: hypothetical protein ENN68_10070 [Methanomicrobia archaeon]|nr:hypothetical protein [Methanomicrobia archaeon]